jgi:hypothetical protein
MGKWLGIVALIILSFLVGASPSPNLVTTPTPPSPAPDLDAKSCGPGCASANDAPGQLSKDEIEGLLLRFGTEPMARGSVALETLLFSHRQVEPLLKARKALPLDAERETFLRTELAKSHAWLDMRVVDTHGVERVRLGALRVELGVKQHVAPRRLVGLQPLEVSGTVRRVGLDHLWTRL